MRNAGTTRVPMGSQDDGALTFDHLHTEASSSPARAAGRRRFPKRALGLLAAGAIVMVAAGCGTLGRASFSESAFLSCTRAHESDTAGGYGAVNPSGTYRGAYQFSQSTWNNTARHAGRPDLVGVDPAKAAPWDQDALALDLYRWQGKSPWGGRC